MKKLLKKTKQKLKEYWTRRMESTQKKISAGAQRLYKSMPSAFKDNWRRKNNKK